MTIIDIGKTHSHRSSNPAWWFYILSFLYSSGDRIAKVEHATGIKCNVYSETFRYHLSRTVVDVSFTCVRIRGASLYDYVPCPVYLISILRMYRLSGSRVLYEDSRKDVVSLGQSVPPMQIHRWKLSSGLSTLDRVCISYRVLRMYSCTGRDCAYTRGSKTSTLAHLLSLGIRAMTIRYKTDSKVRQLPRIIGRARLPNNL